MAHFMRVLTNSTAAPSLPTICQALEQQGYVFDTYPAKDDPRFVAEDWRTLHLSYDNNLLSITLDRSLKDEAEGVMQEEMDEFLAQLQADPDSNRIQSVQQLLQDTAQILACYIPDDISEEGWELVEALLELLLDRTDGTLQVDGEGFFDKEGELLYAME